jgi:hypothetical protein
MGHFNWRWRGSRRRHSRGIKREQARRRPMSGRERERPSRRDSRALCAVIAKTHLRSAAKCGLLLRAAKDLVKPGGFEVWFERREFGLSKMTRCKYMRLADRLYAEAGSKPGLLLSIQPGTDGLPAAFKFDEDRLLMILVSVSDGRSLSDLYDDWDITQRPQNKDEGRTTPPIEAKRSDSPKKVFGRWSGIVEQVPRIFPKLDRGEQDQLLSQLERLLAQLQAFRQEMSSRSEVQ